MAIARGVLLSSGDPEQDLKALVEYLTSSYPDLTFDAVDEDEPDRFDITGTREAIEDLLHFEGYSDMGKDWIEDDEDEDMSEEAFDPEADPELTKKRIAGLEGNEPSEQPEDKLDELRTLAGTIAKLSPEKKAELLSMIGPSDATITKKGDIAPSDSYVRPESGNALAKLIGSLKY